MKTKCALRFAGWALTVAAMVLVGTAVMAEEAAVEQPAAVMTPAQCPAATPAPTSAEAEPGTAEALPLFAPVPAQATEESCCWFEDDCTSTAWQKCKICPNPSNYRCVISVNPETGCSPQGGGSVICL